MKTSKMLHKQLITLFLIIWVIPQLGWSKDLSNQLPADFVRQLIRDQRWLPAFDDETSNESIELGRFWGYLQDNTVKIDQVVDLLFGNEMTKQNDLIKSLPELYPLKVMMLRYASLHPQQFNNTPRVSRIIARWQTRYLYDLIFPVVDMSVIQELTSIKNAFVQKVKAGKISIVDLSPTERAILKSKVSKAHGVTIESKDESTGLYLVSGIYHAADGYFAVDFARHKIDETVITFVHEMIHAADPMLDKYRDQFKSLYPQAIAIIHRLIPDVNADQLISKHFLQQVFYERDLKQFRTIALKLQERRLRQLSQNIQLGSLTPEEQDTLKKWTRSIIGLTIENEYRAYGLSLQLLKALEKLLMTKVDMSHHQKFLQHFISGDDVFILRLAQSGNPFQYSKIHFLKSHYNQAMQLPLTQLFEIFEFIYLGELKSFMENLPFQFANTLNHKTQTISRTGAVLPSWAQKGGISLPTNPYQILTARLTTAWVIRFREYLGEILTRLSRSSVPLINLKSNILDVSDITQGELKLIGIQYKSSPYQKIPKDAVDEFLMSDLDKIPLEIKKHFQLVSYSKDFVSLSAGNGIVDGKEVARNLIRLKLLKLVLWLEDHFALWQNTIIGTKVFLEKLRSELYYDAGELSPERVEQLREELINGLDASALAQDQVDQFEMLIDQLGHLYEIAESENWQSLAQVLFKKVKAVSAALSLTSGYERDESTADKLKSIQTNLEEQLKPHVKECNAQRDNKKIFWPRRGPFLVNEQRFYLTMICYDQTLYAVRQPGDYDRSMTTRIFEGVPHSKIFNGSRRIKLFPLTITIKSPAKSFASWWSSNDDND